MDYQGDMGGGGNYGGGGYDNNSGGGFSSGGGGGTPKARKAYDEQTLIPVTARMILTAQGGENGMTLQDGRELHHVKFIGAVRSHEDASTNATYSIEDGTGLVDVKQWVDANDCPAIIEMRHECMQEHVYVKVIGSLKDYDGRKTLVAHSVRRVSTSNELTHHFLEVVYSSEKYQRKQSIVGGAMPQSMAGPGGGVGFGGVQPGGGAPVAQASFGNAGDELRNQVLNFIRNEGSKFMYQSVLCIGGKTLSSNMVFLV
jgi:replication factor A2